MNINAQPITNTDTETYSLPELPGISFVMAHDGQKWLGLWLYKGQPFWVVPAAEA